MSNMGTAGATDGLARAADDLFEIRSGVTFPAAYALMTRAYFDEFGGDREDLAHIAVKNHDNALVNDHAHLQEEITVDDVLESPEIAAPLGLYDACPISDGAAALVLLSPSYAEEHGLDTGVAITGSGHGGDTMALQDRQSLATAPATRDAAEAAYDDAGISPDDIGLVEVHDCFTIAEVLALEGLGLYSYGEAIGAARRGETCRDGTLPVNLSGGLKAKGHPVGATGAAQVAAVRNLLNGTHPRADAVDDVTVGLCTQCGWDGCQCSCSRIGGGTMTDAHEGRLRRVPRCTRGRRGVTITSVRTATRWYRLGMSVHTVVTANWTKSRCLRRVNW